MYRESPEALKELYIDIAPLPDTPKDENIPYSFFIEEMRADGRIDYGMATAAGYIEGRMSLSERSAEISDLEIYKAPDRRKGTGTLLVRAMLHELMAFGAQQIRIPDANRDSMRMAAKYLGTKHMTIYERESGPLPLTDHQLAASIRRDQARHEERVRLGVYDPATSPVEASWGWRVVVDANDPIVRQQIMQPTAVYDDFDRPAEGEVYFPDGWDGAYERPREVSGENRA